MSTFSSWDDVRLLLVASRAGTVTATARQLGMDPTTVTRRLRALEAAAGVRLLERVRGGLELSRQGQAVCATAADIEGLLAGLGRGLDAEQDEVVGPVRLALHALHAMAWTDLWASLAREHPALELQLVESSALASLDRREADIALRTTQQPPEHLVGWRLGPAEVCVFGVADWQAVPEPERRWIGWTDARPDQDITERLRRGSPHPGPVVLRVQSYAGLVACVRQGLGVAVLPVWFGATDPALVALSEPVGTGFDDWILTHPELRHAPRVRAIMDGLYEALARP